MTERRKRGTGGITWHKGAGLWFAQAHFPDGRRPGKYFPGKPPPPKPWKRDPRPVEAHRWLAKTLNAAAEGRLAHAGAMTVGEQVAEWWALREPVFRKKSESTYRTYGSLLTHLRPLATGRLDALRGNHVQSWINKLLAQGLAPKTVLMARNLLLQAMEAAVDWERIARNPVKATEVPSTRPKQDRRAWSVEEAQQFLASVQRHPLEAFWHVLLFTGMRQGEARGLTWQDVDFDGDTIMLGSSLDDAGQDLGRTKTRTEQRLPMVDMLARVLEQQRDRQDAQRKAAGTSWRSAKDWVFTNPDGSAWNGSYVRRCTRLACQAVGLAPMKPHELRHTAATMMADANVPLAVLASIFGWTTARQLEKTYYHGSDPARREAMKTLMRRLSG